MAKKKKLTKEELKAENQRLKAQVSHGNLSAEDSERIVQTLSMRNVIVYFLVALLPPIGLYIMWKKKEELHIRQSALYAWTMVGTIIFFGYIYYFVTGDYFAQGRHLESKLEESSNLINYVKTLL